MKLSKREKLVEVIHVIIKDERMSLPEVLLALSQVMTDIGLTLWNFRGSSQGLKTTIDVELLKHIEQKHYENPGIDSALIIQAALMVTWAEDWMKRLKEEKEKDEVAAVQKVKDK